MNEGESAFRRLPLSRISASCTRSSAARGTRASFNVSTLRIGSPAMTPNENPRSFRSGAVGFQLIGMRSEVTGDAETTLETAAVGLPSVREERAGVQDRPDQSAGGILVHVLIHQLEVEVEVGDRVPANVRADQVSEGMGRDNAGADGAAGRKERPVLVAPVDTAARAFEIGVDGRRPVVLDQPANRPRARGRPRIGQRIEVSVGQGHWLTVSIDL